MLTHSFGLTRTNNGKYRMHSLRVAGMQADAKRRTDGGAQKRHECTLGNKIHLHNCVDLRRRLHSRRMQLNAIGTFHFYRILPIREIISLEIAFIKYFP